MCVLKFSYHLNYWVSAYELIYFLEIGEKTLIAKSINEPN